MGRFLLAVCMAAVGLCTAMIYRPAVNIAEAIEISVSRHPSWVNPDKVQDRLPVHAVPTVAYRLDPPVAALNTTPERTSLPWSCETIRHAVQNMTMQQIERLARIYRLSKEQRAEAQRCIKEKRA